MIRQIKLLAGLELKKQLGINRLLHSKDEKEKSTLTGRLVAYGILIVMAVLYVSMITGALCSLGMGDLAVNMLVTVSSMMIAFFGILKAGGVIFAKKGHDQLSSLPLHTEAVVFSRYISMYIEDLALAFVIMTPGVVVYGILLKPAAGFYVISLVGTLFIPMLPLVISTVIGTIITALTSRIRKKSAFQTLISLGMMLGIMYLSFSMNRFEDDPDAMANMVVGTVNKLSGVYPLAEWLSSAISYGRIPMLAAFVGVSALALSITIWAVAKLYHPICTKLFASNAKHNYRMTALKSGSVLKTMFNRELKRYFASSIYVTNTIMGPIMGTVASVAMLFAWKELSASEMPFDITNVLPFVLALMFNMMPTTSAAISLEGKEVWIAKTLPITAKDFIISKILVNLVLWAPFWLVSVIVLSIAASLDIMGIIWLALISGLLIVTTSVFCLLIDHRFGDLEYENEVQVVKQSMPATLSCVGGMIINGIMAGLSLLVPYTDIYFAVVCVICIAISILCYRSLCKINLTEL